MQLKMGWSSKSNWDFDMARVRHQTFKRRTLPAAVLAVLLMCSSIDVALAGGYGHGGYGGGYGASASSSSSAAVASTGGYASGWGAKDGNALGGGDGVGIGGGGSAAADFSGNPFLPNANTPLSLTVHKSINLNGIKGLVGGLAHGATQLAGVLTGSGGGYGRRYGTGYGGSYGTGYGGSATGGAFAGAGAHSTAFAGTNQFTGGGCDSPNCNAGKPSSGSDQRGYPTDGGTIGQPKRPASNGAAPCRGSSCIDSPTTDEGGTCRGPNCNGDRPVIHGPAGAHCTGPGCPAYPGNADVQPGYPIHSGTVDRPKHPSSNDAAPCRGSSCINSQTTDEGGTCRGPNCDGDRPVIHGPAGAPCRGPGCPAYPGTGGQPDYTTTAPARPGYTSTAKFPPCLGPGCKGGQPGYPPTTGTAPCQGWSCGGGPQNNPQAGGVVPCNGPECQDNTPINPPNIKKPIARPDNSYVPPPQHSPALNQAPWHPALNPNGPRYNNKGQWHPGLNPNPVCTDRACRDGASPVEDRPAPPRPTRPTEDANSCSGGDCGKPSYLQPTVDIYAHERPIKYPQPSPPQTGESYPSKQHGGSTFPEVQLPSINVNKQISFGLNSALRPGNIGDSESKGVISGLFPGLNLAGSGVYAGGSAASSSGSAAGAGGGNDGNAGGHGCATGKCNNSGHQGASGYGGGYGYGGSKTNSYASASASASSYASASSGSYGR